MLTDMYSPIRASREDGYRFEGLGNYAPTWNLYDPYVEYLAQNRQLNGNWDCPGNMKGSRYWYNVPTPRYEDDWIYRDMGGYRSLSYQDAYTIPSPYFDLHLNNPLPHRWWHKDILTPSHNGYPEYNDMKESFQSSAYSCTRDEGANREAETPVTIYPSDKEPASFTATEPVSTTPAEVSSKQPRNHERSNNARESYADVYAHPEIFAPGNPALYEREALQKYIRDLKKEMLYLRRERRSFYQFNSQFQSMLGSLKRAASQQYEGGCQCSMSKNKGKAVDLMQQDPPGNQGAKVEERDATVNELSACEGISDSNSALERYNAAWNALSATDNDVRFASEKNPEVPWPTVDLQYASLGHHNFYKRHAYSSLTLVPEIMDDLFRLQKWKTFCFFVEAFGFNAYYAFEPAVGNPSPSSGSCRRRRRKLNLGEEHSRLVFRIDLAGHDRSRARCQLETLKSQMQQEKMKWHPDRWRISMRRAVDMLVDEKMEGAKAVWDAVVEVSQACDAHLRAIGGRL